MVLGPAQSLVVEELLVSGKEFVGATFFRQMSSESQGRFAVEESRRVVHKFFQGLTSVSVRDQDGVRLALRLLDYHSRARGGKDDYGRADPDRNASCLPCAS